MAPVFATTTQLLRDPKSVLAALPDHEVLLRRQGGRDVLLVDAIQEGTIRDTLQTVLSALASGLTTAGVRSGLAEALPTFLPWTKALSVPDRLEFLDDLAASARGSCDLEDFSPTARVLSDWRMTARILSAERPGTEATTKSATDDADDEMAIPALTSRRALAGTREVAEMS